MADETIYEIVTKQDTFRLTVPSTYKVTYGKVQPGGKGFDDSGNVLRIYESDTKQRAIFLNFLSFRDLSLPLERLVKATSSKSSQKDDGKGNASRKASVETDAQYEAV